MKARKGDLAAFERISTSTDYRMKSTTYSHGFVVGVILSTTRDGVVKKLNTHNGPYDFSHRGTTRPEIGLVSRDRFRELDGQTIAQMCNEYYRSQDEAVMAIRAAINKLREP